MTTSRLEAFSDAVFAIAFTLLILNFHPEVPAHTTLTQYLLSLWPSYIAYAISILLIGLVWANHHSMFIHIKYSNRMLMFYNTLLLAIVAFLPFPTELLANAIHTNTDIQSATFFYGLVITLGGIAHNALWIYASRHPQLLSKTVSSQYIATIKQWLLLGPSSYAVCTLLSLFLPWLAILGYIVLIIFYWLPPRGESTVNV